MKDEKAEFSARLRAALKEARIDASPAVLEKRFNSRYEGAAVTSQAISGWLNGKSIPRQDKLRVLAALVGVDAHVLQYGGSGTRSRVGEVAQAWEGLSPAERAMVDAYVTLAPPQRRLVRDLVNALAEKGAGAG
jgi:transcriptional regulator with XRE-family HTH domain